jgi:peptidoglycan/LPS O-acetylase OafA/YrhL
VAVAAVVLYHAGVSWVGGGLLGVDVFFVLSGFLITSLLCGEFAATATIRFRSFWAGRARRLLPALFIALLGVAAYCWAFSSTVDVLSVRGDALSTLFYVSNWHFILSNQGYFALSASPSPLLHTWSLAVEEQYYLIWPLIALLVLRRWGRAGLALTTLVGTAVSAALTVVLYHAGVSPNALYYGTGTRAQALLLGSYLGVLASSRSWSVFDHTWARTRAGQRTGAVLALGGCAGLLWAWHAIQGESSFLYNGGFLIVAVCAGLVIAVVTSWPSSVLAWLLARRPLVFLGRISYGVYLYHWILFLTINEAHTGMAGFPLLVTRVAATLLVATVSWRFVEEPIRRRRWLSSWRAGLATAGAATSTVVLLVAATVAPSAGAVLPAAATMSAKSVKSASEIEQLRSTRAFSTNPIRFVLVGDSVAFTAAQGLKVGATRKYGVEVIDKAILGCNLDRNPIEGNGVVYGTSPGENCYSWPTLWRKDVAESRAEVVGLLIGKFELANTEVHGVWVHIGEREWDQNLEAQIQRAIRILAGQGAHVVVFTFPYIDQPVEQLDGALDPSNQPSRVREWNGLLREAAAKYPRLATVVNLNRILDPDGRYARDVDGVEVRWTDGVHVSEAGGEWLQPRVLPTVAQLGLHNRTQGPSGG